jgi:glycosyltransferase involved in cell wall biosynthesis
MIVKNEAMNLRPSLESARGVFDNIVIVDTGSTDRTKEIAREFGAKVFDFDWVDNFAAARNEALAHATGDYAFWLDADDVLFAQIARVHHTLGDSRQALQTCCGGVEQNSSLKTLCRQLIKETLYD